MRKRKAVDDAILQRAVSGLAHAKKTWACWFDCQKISTLGPPKSRSDRHWLLPRVLPLRLAGCPVTLFRMVTTANEVNGNAMRACHHAS
jgi:hypothetical protein